ncbi:helix-turn-helix domain-containing protein [Bradyrhizobium diazoefficiens]|uniref:helix-turn-helix domain-containing protein n=1 Tax=Bradyrhizobium diazoefficiens TaxID=1355477 RepID=UPI00385010A2
MSKSPLGAVKANLGQRVRELRRSRELSQAQLAARVASHQEFISDVERGEANLTLESLVRIATALGVEAVELLGAKSRRRAPRKRA